VLSDCYEQSDAYRKYLYKGYLAEMNCYVFEYEGLEWEGISYVSKANGEEYGLRTQALFSLNQNCYCVDACTELEGERAGIISGLRRRIQIHVRLMVGQDIPANRLLEG
jgi:hypothetical protein